jgi:hypothetical protein
MEGSNMKVSRHEAQESLEAIQQAAAHMRKNIARGGAPFYMILWGAIWFIGFLSNHFVSEDYQGWIWLPLTTIGAILSAYFGYRASLRIRSQGTGRLFLFGLVLLSYSALWLWIARPTSGEQASTLVVTFIMFSYVVVGLWMERVLLWVGLLTTAMTLIGYFVFPGYYNLWMAFLGGGTLAASGLYIQRRWK